MASRKSSMFVDFAEGQTIEKYFLEIERWDMRMHFILLNVYDVYGNK